MKYIFRYSIKFIAIAISIMFVVNCYAYNKNLIEDLSNDKELFFVVSPHESKKLLNKYNQNQFYDAAFKEILEDYREYDKDLVNYVIYIMALSRNKEILNDIKKIDDMFQVFNKNIHFYNYRIGVEKDKHFKFLKRSLDELAQKPFDSELITFLPFLDDIEVAITYINELAPKADGAMSELLSWSVEYMLLENKNKPSDLKKIKASSGYKLLRSN